MKREKYWERIDHPKENQRIRLEYRTNNTVIEYDYHSHDNIYSLFDVKIYRDTRRIVSGDVVGNIEQLEQLSDEAILSGTSRGGIRTILQTGKNTWTDAHVPFEMYNEDVIVMYRDLEVITP